MIILLTLSACRVRIIEIPIELDYIPEQELTTETPPMPEVMQYDPQPSLPEIEPQQEEIESEREIEEITNPTIEILAYESLPIPTSDETQQGTIPNECTNVVSVVEVITTPQVTVETLSDTTGETTLEDYGDGTLGLIIDRYTGVLNSGLGSLFECQRLYIYFERLYSFHTVNRNSLEHTLITQSGGHNVAARRSNDAFIIDAEWLIRRNPAVIVRSVEPHILGSDITSTIHAQAVRYEIINRPGLENTSAVLHRRILLISEELLHSDEGRLLAKLHIAHAMYPTLFTEINIQEIHRQIKDAGGRDYTVGIFTF